MLKCFGVRTSVIVESTPLFIKEESVSPSFAMKATTTRTDSIAGMWGVHIIAIYGVRAPAFDFYKHNINRSCKFGHLKNKKRRNSSRISKCVYTYISICY